MEKFCWQKFARRQTVGAAKWTRLLLEAMQSALFFCKEI
jgi:hypothetical protein